MVIMNRRNISHHQPSNEPFTNTETLVVLHKIKVGMAPCYNNVLPDFLLHLGSGALEWVTSLFIRIIEEGRLQKEFEISKIVAVCKPGKDHNVAANYGPISLLS